MYLRAAWASSSAWFCKSYTSQNHEANNYFIKISLLATVLQIYGLQNWCGTVWKSASVWHIVAVWLMQHLTLDLKGTGHVVHAAQTTGSIKEPQVSLLHRKTESGRERWVSPYTPTGRELSIKLSWEKPNITLSFTMCFTRAGGLGSMNDVTGSLQH